MNFFFWRKKVTPNVSIQEKDMSVVLNDDAPKRKLFFSSTTGPLKGPYLLGKDLITVRWYQFWRWHLIPEAKRRRDAFKEELNQFFGKKVG